MSILLQNLSTVVWFVVIVRLPLLIILILLIWVVLIIIPAWMLILIICVISFVVVRIIVTRIATSVVGIILLGPLIILILIVAFIWIWVMIHVVPRVVVLTIWPYVTLHILISSPILSTSSSTTISHNSTNFLAGLFLAVSLTNSLMSPTTTAIISNSATHVFIHINGFIVAWIWI